MIDEIKFKSPQSEKPNTDASHSTSLSITSASDCNGLENSKNIAKLQFDIANHQYKIDYQKLANQLIVEY